MSALTILSKPDRFGCLHLLPAIYLQSIPDLVLPSPIPMLHNHPEKYLPEHLLQLTLKLKSQAYSPPDQHLDDELINYCAEQDVTLIFTGTTHISY